MNYKSVLKNLNIALNLEVVFADCANLSINYPLTISNFILIILVIRSCILRENMETIFFVGNISEFPS